MPSLGLCSWSLQPRVPEELVNRVLATDLRGVQLALVPLADGSWPLAQTRSMLNGAGVCVHSGMLATVGEDYTSLESIKRTGGVRPDSTWPQTLALAHASAEVAAEMGLKLVTFHAGFLPHDRRDLERGRLLDRLRMLATMFSGHGASIALETGQESAETLVDVLCELDHPTVGVNFDPANMILYGMGDPIAALKVLTPWIRQVHIKDARPADHPGTWGCEVPVGQGCVDWPGFFGHLNSALPNVDCIIEREAGESRVADIKSAAKLVRELRKGV